MLEKLTQTRGLGLNSQGASLSGKHLKPEETFNAIGNLSIQNSINPLIPTKKMNGYKRISLQVSPTLHRKFKIMANEREETMNSLINTALKEFIRQEEEQIENVKRMKERLNKK